MRQLQEKRQLPELELELRQCGGGSERATVDGSIVHDDAKDLELGKNIVAGSRLRVLHGSNGIAVRCPN